MSTPAPERTPAAPAHYPEHAEFWAATAEGRLLLRRCTACRQLHWHPRGQCPFCMSDALQWEPAAGTGDIYTLSVCHRVGPVPFAIAYVRLDEGITMLSNIVDCDLDTLHIGQRVRVVMKAAEDGTKVPMFTPVAV